MQTLELGKTSQSFALMTKMERGDVKFGPTMGPLKLFEPSNHTFAPRPFESMRSILGNSVRQRGIFSNRSESTLENGIEQNLEGVPLRLDVGMFWEVGNEA